MSDESYLIAGLGNPGPEYVATRHNVGFQVLDQIASKHGFSFEPHKWESLHCRTSLWGARLHFVKPQSYMNLSGKTIAAFARFFKIQPDHILVIHDDLDMVPGRVKLVAGGGPGGHNGIRSTIQCLGTRDFFRLKYGIGRPGQNGIHADMPVERFVLAPFSEKEQSLLDERMEVMTEGLQAFVRKGAQQAMNILNVAR
ncbi:MAG: aminoacyl-tRNA hydrolase [Thermodesulfobacteriota bacterium]